MSSIHPAAGTNLAVLVGTLSREPETRVLPSGDEVVALELTIHPEGARAESVPVAWVPGHAPTTWARGDELLVVGRVRRRFFRAGGATQSRTEVVATTVVPTRRAAAAGKALTAALRAAGHE
jgi:single-strand DNA-binding protein